MTPQQFAPLVTPVSFVAAAARSVPADYILCTDDRVLPPPTARRMAARIEVEPRTFAAGHSPFLSRPDELAVLLLALAA